MISSCLCGAIEYQLQDNINTLIHCHCSRCRKETGSAFSSVARILTESFSLIKGEELIKTYSENGIHRHFCSICGSQLFTSRDAFPDFYSIRVGLLNDPINPTKKLHVYVSSKAKWDEILDHHPQFETMPDKI